MTDIDDDFDPLALDVQLCFPLYAATRLMVQAYRPRLLELGLTYPQYLVMMVLWERDGLTVKQVGGKLLLDSGTLTPLLKRLEGQGFVRRQRGPNDERIVRTFLTDQGRELRQQALTIPQSLMHDVHLEMDEVVEARALVRRMLKRLADFRGLRFEDDADRCG